MLRRKRKEKTANIPVSRFLIKFLLNFLLIILRKLFSELFSRKKY